MAPVTCKFSGVTDQCKGEGVLAPVWLNIDVITEDSRRGYTSGWEFPVQNSPGQILHPGSFVPRNARRSSCKVLSDFSKNQNVLTYFSKTQYQI
jgi:hypothetical protein